MLGLQHVPIEVVAGFTAGGASTLVSHPLDVIKTRLQVDRGRSSSHLGSSWAVARHVVRNEGGVAALYRGLFPNLMGNTVSWAIYFNIYEVLKDEASKRRGFAPGQGLRMSDYFMASGMAGALTAFLTNPIWVIKTRMLSSGRDRPGAYRDMRHGFTTILREEGVLGLYRGLVPSLFGVSHGAVQFAVYEVLKGYGVRSGRRHVEAEGEGGDAAESAAAASWRQVQQKPSNLSTILSSTTAKSIATCITYPYQVVRARLQTYDAGKTYASARDVLVQIARQEGPVGFYKGLVPALVRVLPTTCVTFLTYENFRYYLRDRLRASP